MLIFLAPAAHHARIFSSYDDAGYRDNGKKKSKKKRNSKYKKKLKLFSDIGSRSSVDSMPCVEDPVSIYSDPNLKSPCPKSSLKYFNKIWRTLKDFDCLNLGHCIMFLVLSRCKVE